MVTTCRGEGEGRGNTAAITDRRNIISKALCGRRGTTVFKQLEGEVRGTVGQDAVRKADGSQLKRTMLMIFISSLRAVGVHSYR